MQNYWFSLNFLVFIVNFVHLELFFFTLHIFLKKIIQKYISKTYRITSLAFQSSFRNGLNDLSSSTDFYLKGKVLEANHKVKYFFKNFEYFLSKFTFLKL